MADTNPYAAPKSEVFGVQENANPKPSALLRFTFTTLWALPVFFVFVLMGKLSFRASVGATIMSMLAGVFALCIPARSKPLFILPAIFGSLVLVFVIGWAASKQY